MNHRWEKETLGGGASMFISALEAGGRMIDMSVVRRGGVGDFVFDVIDGDKVVYRGYEQTLPAAQTSAEKHARRQLTKCVSGGR